MRAPLDPQAAPAIRWGIIGPGGIAQRFAREVPMYTRSRIVAVGSRDLSRAQEFVGHALASSQGVRTYGSYEELVADDGIDAIYIASPHSEHHDHAVTALEAGKPVLVEKAFTLSATQAESVFSTADDHHLFAMEAMWSRFLPHYTVMSQILRSGELGEVHSIVGVHAQSLNLDPTWRLMNPALGGGALLDLGIYPLSLIQWLWGVPDRIRATGTLTATGVDLRESISLWYGDRLAVAYADMGAAGKSSLQIVGTKARLEVQDWFYTPQDLTMTMVDGRSRVFTTKVEGGFQYEAAEVAWCISQGLTESTVMPWRDTVEVLRIADAVRAELGVSYPGEPKDAEPSG